MFGKKTTPPTSQTSPEKGQDLVVSNTTKILARRSVSDPTTQTNHDVIGTVMTNFGGDLEVSNDMRLHVVATSGKQIFYSKNERDNPKVLSQVAELKMKLGGEGTKIVPVDASTIQEIYRVATNQETQQLQRKTTDTSRMQRELLAIVANAARINASDIHIMVNMDNAIIKYRVDGVLRMAAETQPSHAFDMLSAAFAMADESDSSYQMKSYQGARISTLKTTLPDGVQSLRLQFNPLANDGRYAIIRILYSASGRLTSIEDLGYSIRQVNLIKTMSARPVGINVISGPTGSGKSTTLKAVLEGIIDKRSGEINVITIEDPPEYVIKDAQQMPVTNASTPEERSIAFTKAISAGMRSDPDILMIGEIRDLASANLAVEGALSGHPVYASLHANTAMDILTRLRNMGIEEFKVFDSTIFSGLIGQRLVRKLCPHCKRPYEEGLKEGCVEPLFNERVETMLGVTPETLKKHALHLANPEGCTRCSKGYLGRSVVSEIILTDEEFMGYLWKNDKTKARDYWFEKLHGIDLLGNAWLRALKGHISPLDIEHTVALLAPHKAHALALAQWEQSIS